MNRSTKFLKRYSGLYFCLQSEDLNKDLEYAIANRVTSWCIDYFQGFLEKKVDFLMEYGHFIEKLIINSPLINDLVPIHALINLKELHFSDVNSTHTAVDLEKVRNLEVLTIGSKVNYVNISRLNFLKKLILTHYNEDVELFNLSDLKELVHLEIGHSSVKSLKGIGNLPKISYLELSHLSKLINIKELINFRKVLKNLVIINCDKILNIYESLTRLDQLSTLKLIRTVEKIESIDFLENFKNLSELNIIDTKIKDGNVSFLKNKNLSALNYTYYPHYNARASDLRLEMGI